MRVGGHGWLGGLAAALAALAPSALAQAAPVTAGNGVYEVAVEPTGEYTARTGPLHPGPQGYSVLYGGGGLTPLTTWDSVRSYASGVEYVLRPYSASPSAGFNCESIDDSATPVVQPLPDATAPVGVQVTWSVTHDTDRFDVVQTVTVDGTTFSDSVVEVTTCVRNPGAAAASFGIRYLWDWEIGFTDGPWLGVRPPYPPLEPLLDSETTWTAPSFDFYDVSDTATPTTSPPLYKVSGSTNGPVHVPAATPPDVLSYADWPSSQGTCFDYATRGRTIAGSRGDSAVLYFWGPDAARAIDVPAGGEACVTQFLFAYTNDPPPLCAVTARVAPPAPACAPDAVTLDASLSTSVSCSGGLEYRFTDPSGIVERDWDPAATFAAPTSGTWTVEARCAAAPDCASSTAVDVVIEQGPPAFTVTATDSDPCQPGMRIEWPFNALGSWDPVTWGTNGVGTFSVFRSAVSCADALAQPALVTDLAATYHDDLTAVEGQPYWYAVLAEAQAPAVACPAGPERGAPFAVACIPATASDQQTGTPPGTIGAALRVTKVGDMPELGWTLAPPLASDETDIVLRRALDPRNLVPYARYLTSYSYLDGAATERLVFYQVLRANACGILSGD